MYGVEPNINDLKSSTNATNSNSNNNDNGDAQNIYFYHTFINNIHKKEQIVLLVYYKIILKK